MQIHTAMTDIAGQFYSIMELNVHPDIGSTIGRRVLTWDRFFFRVDSTCPKSTGSLSRKKINDIRALFGEKTAHLLSILPGFYQV